MPAGALQQGHQIQGPAPIPENLKDPVAGPTQPVGVGGSTRSLPPGKAAKQQFQPFRQGHHGARIGGRQAVARTTGQIVLLHRQGHGPGFPFSQQVFAPHHTLQLRKLRHHLADQVVFAEMGGAAGCRRRRHRQGQGLEQGVREPFEALGSIQQAAQSLGEGDPIELIAAIDAGNGPIGPHKKGSVVQTGSQYPLVAPSHRIGSGRIATIGHKQEAGKEQVPRLQGERIGQGTGTSQGHIALMGSHHGAKHLGRQRQIALIKRSAQHLGGFDQIHQLIE